MRNISLQLSKLFAIAFIVASFGSVKICAQTITLDSTFSSSTEIYPFNQSDTIYGLGVSGNIVLNSDTSLVRLVFVDSDYNEYLLYEAYPYICDSWSFSISNVVDETKYLNLTLPHSLYVYVYDASIELTTLHCTSRPIEFADSLQLEHKQSIEALKISAFNDNIEKYDMIWFAAETSVSDMSYSDKKDLFGENYNLLGLDYYAGGVYDPVPGAVEKDNESTLVPKFDWRNRHGANDPNKEDFYYDYDASGGGWLTPIKNQKTHPGCKGLCYIYAPISTLEGLLNVYLNKHEDFDFAEQHVLDCDGYDSSSECPTQCICGYTYNTHLFIENNGIVNQECYPADDPGSCNPCPNPQYFIKMPNGVSQPNNTIDEKKENLILHGPHTSRMESYGSSTANHFMTLVGYGVLEVGDYFHGPSANEYFEIVEGHEYEGVLYWIYKNSYGTGYGENGYMYHVEDQWIPQYCEYFNLPFEDIVVSNSYEIGCYDRDNDGYYWWGIGEKPTACTGPDSRDSDDSEPRIGPYDDNYYGTPVKPIMEISINNQVINNGGFYVFTDINQSISLSIDVKNLGDAQLNFEEVSAFPDPYANVTLSGDDASSFSYGHDLLTEIAMINETGDEDSFTISYDGTCTGSCTCVITIHLEECDMEDFSFAIIYTDCDHIPSNERITSNVTWDGWNVILDNYNIKNGGVLTISGNVGFSDQIDLIVEPGGRLIIDEGVLTNVCGNTWKGIDVWGNSSLSQYPSSNQGYLSIINGGKIQNADIAVQVADAPDVNTYTVKTTGGIFRCDSAIFINNRYDVVIYPYDNINPGTGMEAPNLCSFKNSYFLTKNTTTDARWHVGLWGVDGIRFKGCTFENKTDFVNTPLNDKIDVGIYSHNSGFYVEDYCTSNTTPCTSEKPCNFTNLRYGIYAANSIYSKFISIDTAIFLNNLTGIYMSAVDEQRITTNDFLIDHFQDFAQAYDTPKPVGLYLEACKNYMVEENICTNKSTIENATGMHILNTGLYANEVYNNSFKGFYCGITAAGENRDEYGTGLCIKCNDFTNCNNDIHVTEQGGLSGNFGIAFYQGNVAPEPPQGQDPDPTYAAGNIFTAMEGDYTNYTNNQSCYSIEYTYHGDVSNPNIKVEPNPTSPQQPTQHIGLTADDEVSYNSKEEACPSNFGTIIDIPSEMNMMASESSILTAYEDTLNLFVDGGDTETLNQDVQLSFPDEALEIRLELLNSSPYLSDTVMKSSIAKENVLPNVMIRDVLVANPQSAKSPSVLQSLDDRFVPMPDYMMNEILMGQYTFGNKELLEQKLSKHKRLRDLAFAKLMRHYHSDTINTAAASDSIVSLLNDQNYLGARYQLCMFYLSKHDSANAFSTLNNIPIDFELTSTEQSTWELYSDLIDINWEIMNDTFAIDSVHITSLLEIYSSQNTMPSLYARNILINRGEINYNEPVFLPSSLKLTPIWHKQTEAKFQSQLNIFPNPAYS
ncbi:MAG: C1 family peptidase [Bacteroidales bacterium]|nr:C1 family peptidase [Bacteroidales bacterium]